MYNFRFRLIFLLTLLFSFISLSAVYSETYLEHFDNDSGIISNEGVILTNGKLTPKSNILSVENNIIGLWRFNQNTGNTVIEEISGYSGVQHNMENTDWVTGVFGNALRFDGENEYIIIDNDTPFNNLNEFTYEFWIKTFYQSPLVSEAILYFTFDDNFQIILFLINYKLILEFLRRTRLRCIHQVK